MCVSSTGDTLAPVTSQPPSPARSPASTQTLTLNAQGEAVHDLDQLHVMAQEYFQQKQRQHSPSLSPRRGSEDLEHENDILRRHLERIGKMSTSSGGFNIEAVQVECEKWKEKYKQCKKEREQLREELMKEREEVGREREEVAMMRAERESLLATIQLLQDELEQSESMRASLHTHTGC